jgi:hypothetical protein
MGKNRKYRSGPRGCITWWLGWFMKLWQELCARYPWQRNSTSVLRMSTAINPTLPLLYWLEKV